MNRNVVFLAGRIGEVRPERNGSVAAISVDTEGQNVDDFFHAQAAAN